MKNEMIKFVSENFEVIKNKYTQHEEEMIAEEVEYFDEDEILEFLSILENQMNVETSEELIEVIRTREGMFNSNSYNFDNELFNILKGITESN
jgi:hypothetical protein